MERAKDEVRVIMRARRHDAPGSDDDFELETNDTYMDIYKQITSIFFTAVSYTHLDVYKRQHQDRLA